MDFQQQALDNFSVFDVDTECENLPGGLGLYDDNSKIKVGERSYDLGLDEDDDMFGDSELDEPKSSILPGEPRNAPPPQPPRPQ